MKEPRTVSQTCCDRMASIPMVGESVSLNVAMATGVMLYEVFNQRGNDLLVDGMLEEIPGKEGYSDGI